MMKAMGEMDEICADLADEHADLDRLVAGLTAAQWDTPTPAPGWTVRDQVSHIWFFDQRALLALTDAEAFAADARLLMASGGTDASVVPGRATTGAEMLEQWRTDRARLLDVARYVEPSTRVPWYGPAMGARSFVTARLMETWAHGQDVADAFGVVRAATPRLRHVAHIGVRARPFSYATNRREMPSVDIHVELATPDGEMLSWGSPDAVDAVRGPLLDFCLVVTQRRHHADTALQVVGAAALDWIEIAQAFAGPPGARREPGQFTETRLD
jgi:uncharacterized protein (TIGR03084 family)